jgi:hypothetical protein
VEAVFGLGSAAARAGTEMCAGGVGGLCALGEAAARACSGICAGGAGGHPEAMALSTRPTYRIST